MVLRSMLLYALGLLIALTALAGLCVAQDQAPPAYVIGAAAPATDVAGGTGPRMDVVFLIDTTGSMGDEIDVVKNKMRDMVAQIAGGEPTPIVRFGLVLYRDREDEYVTQLRDLTDDIDAVVATIQGITADGGGDYPESLNEGLHVAINDVSWDPDEDVDRTIFLIADAPPHTDYADDYDPKLETQTALERMIIIHAIGCSGLEDADAELFRSVAQSAEGTFNYLTYRREVAAEDGTTTVVLEEGGRSYAIADDAEMGTDGWRKGGEALFGAGAAVEVAPAPAVSPRDGSRAEMADGPAEDAVGEGMVAVGEAENNLDSLLVGQLQLQAERRGVVYATTGESDAMARYEGYSSGVNDEKTQVIRDQESWQKLWSEHAARIADPKPECPEIDFDTCMVIAIFQGERRSGGYAVHIGRIALHDGEDVEVSYYAEEPGRGTVVTMALTQPYSMVVVKRHSGEVTFVEVDAAPE